MRTIKALLLLVFFGFVFSGCALLTGTDTQQASETDAMENSSDETTGEKTEETQMYTLEEVSLHNSAEDCWIAIEGKVYDVTDFIASQKHPGGEAILLGCGSDATELYNERPNGSGAHSDQARSFLPNYYIGDVKQ